MKLIKKIYTISVLLFNVIIRRRRYSLTFVAEKTDMGKLWYYDFKHWGFNHHNLLMVSGADTLCEAYSKGQDKVTVKIIASKKDLGYGCYYDHYVREDFPKGFNLVDKILYGANYHEQGEINWVKRRHFWICPVTLFVLGRYPKHIYIKNKL